jgi:hypothetical protein
MNRATALWKTDELSPHSILERDQSLHKSMYELCEGPGYTHRTDTMQHHFAARFDLALALAADMLGDDEKLRILIGTQNSYAALRTKILCGVPGYAESLPRSLSNPGNWWSLNSA